MQALGHLRSHTLVCQELASTPTNHLKQALGSLAPADKLQELTLPASSLSLTPGPGFIHQWAGNSSRVFRTLTLPTSEPALALGDLRVLQPAAL